MGAKPCRNVAGDAATGLLILCDHAENSLPERYGLLGLRPEDLHRHIAYDMGAAGVAVRLAEMLGAPALLSCFSRLLIDPNRGLDDPTLIMQISDGLIVPGNVSLRRERDRFTHRTATTSPTIAPSRRRSRRGSMPASRR